MTQFHVVQESVCGLQLQRLSCQVGVCALVQILRHVHGSFWLSPWLSLSILAQELGACTFLCRSMPSVLTPLLEVGYNYINISNNVYASSEAIFEGGWESVVKAKSDVLRHASTKLRLHVYLVP